MLPYNSSECVLVFTGGNHSDESGDIMNQGGIVTTVSDVVRRAGFELAELDSVRGISDEIRNVALWHSGMKKPAVDELVVIPHAPHLLGDVSKTLAATGRLHFVLCGWPVEAIAELPSAPLKRHSVIRIPDIDSAVDFIRAAATLLQPDDSAELRRLTALQRSFSQSLEGANPFKELLARLGKVTGAVCVIVDGHNRVLESTGSLPLSVILDQVMSTNANVQQIAVDGWGGLAIALASISSDDESAGWIVVASQREGFPTAQDTAATHIAASLADTARKMRVYADRQQNAIRASIFEEALDFRVVNDAPELTNRIFASGIVFDRPLRVATVFPSQGSVNIESLRAAERGFVELLSALDIPYLHTTRDSLAVFLLQTDTDSLQRTLRANREVLGHLRFGIGREVNSVADVADSFADGLLGQKTLDARRSRENFVTFEEFDFATRLFADIGLAKLGRSSRQFLAPVLEKEPLFDALFQYFGHAQNANAAADALGVHHNTLRYRLSKVEELMEIRLNDPAAIASIFLALTALDLVGARSEGRGASDRRGPRSSREGVNTRRQLPIDDEPPTRNPFGAKFGLGDADSL